MLEHGHLYISLDGSGGSMDKDGTEHPPTWSFSVFSTDDSDSTFFHGFLTVYVRDDTRRFALECFDSFDFESVAFTWAMLWVLSHIETFKTAL